jgi:4'-phosphopantetheinyl transferase
MPLGLPAESSRVPVRADASPCGNRGPGFPDPGLVEVWRTDCHAVCERVGDVLDLPERARAARIVDQRRRGLWIRSRGALRMLLGRYLACDPREIAFQLGAHGKPALVDGTGEAGRLRFNVSHSGSLMLVAVSAEREVGVDVELIGPRRERYTVGFLREWTRREAVAKCVGTGLSASLDESVLFSSGDGGPASAGLWTAEVDVGPHAVATLAVEGGDSLRADARDPLPSARPDDHRASRPQR